MKKKILLCILMCIFLVFASVNTVCATAPDWFKQYRIETIFIDGIEVRAHDVIVNTDCYIDPSEYSYDTPKDFFGVDVIYVGDTGGELNGTSIFNGAFIYCIVLAEPTMNPLEAIEILEKHENVISVTVNTIEYPGIEYALGDVNNSGGIDMMDYVLLKRNYFGTFDFDKIQLRAGDVNNSGGIDMMDYILLKRAYFGTYAIEYDS